jgi:hypothetical protein
MAQRKRNHSLELVWRGSEAYGSESDLFTSQYPTGNYGERHVQAWHVQCYLGAWQLGLCVIA